MDEPELDETQATPHLSRRVQLIEAGVVLLLIVPSMALSLFVEDEMRPSFPVVAASLIARDLALTALVLYFVWRNGEAWASIGWTRRRWGKEALVGVGLFIPATVAASLLAALLAALGVPEPPTTVPEILRVEGPGEVALAVVLVVVVAFSEEILFRGYLLLRLRPITGSTTAAVLLSSFVFALGHGYQGVTGVIAVGALGVIFALVYLWRRSLVAPIVMHFLQNFVGLVVAPFLMSR